VPPVPDRLAEPGVWSRVVVGAWKSEAAIHLKEGRASLLGLKIQARSPGIVASIVPALGDNMGEVVANDRGRGRDKAVNALCRRGAAIRLGACVDWPRRYIDTARNPSDSDSRIADRGGLRPGERLRAGWRAGASPAIPRWHGFCASPAVLAVGSGAADLVAAAAEVGLKVALPLDRSVGVLFDLRNRDVRSRVLGWILSRRIWWLHVSLLPGRIGGAPGSAAVAPDASWGAACACLLRAARRSRALVSVETLGGQLVQYESVKTELRKCGCTHMRIDKFSPCHHCRPVAHCISLRHRPIVVSTNYHQLLHRRYEGFGVSSRFGSGGAEDGCPLLDKERRRPPAVARLLAGVVSLAAERNAWRPAAAPGEDSLAPTWERQLARSAGWKVDSAFKCPALPRAARRRTLGGGGEVGSAGGEIPDGAEEAPAGGGGERCGRGWPSEEATGATPHSLGIRPRPLEGDPFSGLLGRPFEQPEHF